MSKGTKMKEWAKNGLIVLLLCSAVWLLADSQIFGHLPRQIGARQPGEVQQMPAPAAGQVTLPLAAAVTNAGGVYAARYDAAAVNDLFQPMLPVLGEALADAAQSEPVQAEQWHTVLTDAGGLWLELQGNVPAQVLCRWIAGVDNPNLTGNVRQLLLCVEQGQVCLYYRREDQTCHKCTVESVSAEYLESMLAQAIPNGAMFAAADQRYQAIAPQTLILEQTPNPKEYTAFNPLGQDQQMDELLQAMEFAPGITTIYQTPEGWRARSGNDTLTISNDGLLGYERVGDEQRYPLTGGEQDPAVYRAVETARRLVCASTQRWGGTAVYLQDVQQESDGWHITFGYVVDAIPVQTGDHGWCADVLVDERGVARYEIRLRGYQPTEKTTLLLPQLQAAAVLEQMGQAGSGLLLSYLDRGETVRAGWIAEQ